MAKCSLSLEYLKVTEAMAKCNLSLNYSQKIFWSDWTIVKSFIALSCPKQFDKNCISSWNYSDGDIQWSNRLTLFLINLCTIWNRHHHNLLNSPVPSLAHLASKPRSTWLKGNNNFFWPNCVYLLCTFSKLDPYFLFFYI